MLDWLWHAFKTVVYYAMHVFVIILVLETLAGKRRG